MPAKAVVTPKGEASPSGAFFGGSGSPAVTRPTADSTTIKEGWLEKTNKKGKHWKKRWVVANLVDKTLKYYGENPHKTLYLYDVAEEAKGVIDISAATASVATPAEVAAAPTPFCIMLRSNGRETLLAARCVPECLRSSFSPLGF